MTEVDGSRRLELVRTAQQQWIAALTDLGGRNTLLYYKDRRAGTLDLAHADPEALDRFTQSGSIRLTRLFKDADLRADAIRRVQAIHFRAAPGLPGRLAATANIRDGGRHMTNRALLVVDMQNGFCHPDGSFSQIGMGLAGAQDAVRISQPRTARRQKPREGQLTESARFALSKSSAVRIQIPGLPSALSVSFVFILVPFILPISLFSILAVGFISLRQPFAKEFFIERGPGPLLALCLQFSLMLIKFCAQRAEYAELIASKSDAGRVFGARALTWIVCCCRHASIALPLPAPDSGNLDQATVREPELFNRALERVTTRLPAILRR